MSDTAKTPITYQFSGGQDDDNEITMRGLSFDQALRVIELLGAMVRENRAASPPSPAQETEDANA